MASTPQGPRQKHRGWTRSPQEYDTRAVSPPPLVLTAQGGGCKSAGSGKQPHYTKPFCCHPHCPVHSRGSDFYEVCRGRTSQNYHHHEKPRRQRTEMAPVLRYPKPTALWTDSYRGRASRSVHPTAGRVLLHICLSLDPAASPSTHWPIGLSHSCAAKPQPAGKGLQRMAPALNVTGSQRKGRLFAVSGQRGFSSQGGCGSPSASKNRQDFLEDGEGSAPLLLQGPAPGAQRQATPPPWALRAVPSCCHRF